MFGFCFDMLFSYTYICSLILTANFNTMEKKSEKKLRVVVFLPAIVVEHVSSGSQYLQTSSCVYEDLMSAQEALNHLIKIYSRDDCYSVLRWSIKRKVIVL